MCDNNPKLHLIVHCQVRFANKKFSILKMLTAWDQMARISFLHWNRHVLYGVTRKYSSGDGFGDLNVGKVSSLAKIKRFNIFFTSIRFDSGDKIILLQVRLVLRTCVQKFPL